jgi:hypothetical protein
MRLILMIMHTSRMCLEVVLQFLDWTGDIESKLRITKETTYPIQLNGDVVHVQMPAHGLHPFGFVASI